MNRATDPVAFRTSEEQAQPVRTLQILTTQGGRRGRDQTQRRGQSDAGVRRTRAPRRPRRPVVDFEASIREAVEQDAEAARSRVLAHQSIVEPTSTLTLPAPELRSGSRPVYGPAPPPLPTSHSSYNHRFMGDPLPNREEAKEDEEAEEEDAGSDVPDNGDVLPLPVPGNDQRWLRGQPRTQPLQYDVPVDNQGGVEISTTKFTVDFDDSKSVSKANKARSLKILRARQRLGAPAPRRPSTKDREWTEEEIAFIRSAFVSHGIATGGRRPSGAKLHAMFASNFPNTSRSQHSLSTQVDRNPSLKALKLSYRL